jgi:hypothetical protein
MRSCAAGLRQLGHPSPPAPSWTTTTDQNASKVQVVASASRSAISEPIKFDPVRGALDYAENSAGAHQIAAKGFGCMRILIDGDINSVFLPRPELVHNEHR